MNVGQLLEALNDLDPELEVQIRIEAADPEEDYNEPLSEFFGEYSEVTDDNNILIEYGKLTIIGDFAGYE